MESDGVLNPSMQSSFLLNETSTPEAQLANGYTNDEVSFSVGDVADGANSNSIEKLTANESMNYSLPQTDFLKKTPTEEQWSR